MFISILLNQNLKKKSVENIFSETNRKLTRAYNKEHLLRNMCDFLLVCPSQYYSFQCQEFGLRVLA